MVEIWWGILHFLFNLLMFLFAFVIIFARMPSFAQYSSSYSSNSSVFCPDCWSFIFWTDLLKPCTYSFISCSTCATWTFSFSISWILGSIITSISAYSIVFCKNICLFNSYCCSDILTTLSFMSTRYCRWSRSRFCISLIRFDKTALSYVF